MARLPPRPRPQAERGCREVTKRAPRKKYAVKLSPRMLECIRFMQKGAHLRRWGGLDPMQSTFYEDPDGSRETHIVHTLSFVALKERDLIEKSPGQDPYAYPVIWRLTDAGRAIE